MPVANPGDRTRSREGTVRTRTIAALCCAVALGACRVDVNDKGKLPDVDVKNRDGKAPEVDVRPGRMPDVDVSTDSVTLPEVKAPDIQVPDVKMPHVQLLGADTGRARTDTTRKNP